jgi:hypothetical protein
MCGGTQQQHAADSALCRAHVDHGYSLSEIGPAVGLYSIISRIVNRQDSDHARNKT